MKILGNEYEIIEADATIMDDKIGLCDTINHRIYLREGLNQSVLKSTLIHEIIHAIDLAMQIGLEEKQVEALGNGLFAIMKDNLTEFDLKLNIEFEDE